jgi:prephenate dehydrogenase
VVSTDDTDDVELWSDIARLALDCGAHVVPAETAEHDAAVGRVSHLPHVLAAVLASVGADGGPLALALGAGSFRDGTRVAGSRPELVRAMCEGNRAGLLEALDDALGRLGAARGSLASTGSLGATIVTGHRGRGAYDQLAATDRDKLVIRLDAPDAMAELTELGRRGGRVVQLDGATALAEVPNPV